ncbi:Tetratricopeptide repeat-containing protein [Bizionia echini]|uniref:Tetratricopeptide repeat-containing protein n=1 Tax=Bizionia echini TaxID=649333 RepID=A0A1I4ZC65_9FLAO|nr:tetratricopeptide repeat protein [Bizionia echini]SFN47798.1 Tetratricopeptide repeat-containing protein [Bizionia echini]
MRFSFTYIILFLVGVIKFNTVLAGNLQNSQQIDSLITARMNDIYENPDQSIAYGLSVYQDSKTSNVLKIRALMLMSLGYTSKRDYQKALKYIIKANELSSDSDSQTLKTRILFSTGILYQQLKIYDKSIEYMEKIEQVSLMPSLRDSIDIQITLANSYIVKGFIYKDNLNCDIALEYFDKGVREYEKFNTAKHNANLSIIYYNKGNCYILLSEYGNAKNSFNRSIGLAKLDKANSLISFAQKGLAEVYTLEGNYQDAINLLQKALETSKNVGDLVLNLGIYKGLFENYLALNQWDEYQKYYDLYLKTQLAVKISERNSVSDSIDENSKLQNEKITVIQNQFQNRLKWIIVTVFIIGMIVVLLEIKSRKRIKILQKTVEKTQNLKSNLEMK